MQGKNKQIRVWGQVFGRKADIGSEAVLSCLVFVERNYTNMSPPS